MEAFPSLSQTGEVEEKRVLYDSLFPWRSKGMDAAAKVPFEEGWAAGEGIVGTKSAEYTGGDVEWQLRPVQW